MQAMDLLSGLLAVEEHHEGHHEHPTTFTSQHLERLYIFALMWSVGALLELDERAKMEEYIVQMVRHPLTVSIIICMVMQGGLDLPPVQAGETIFEYVVEKTGQWAHWSSRVQEYSYPPDQVPEYASILVPNVDNVRTTFLVDLIARQEKAVLLIGEQGTAKTVMVQGYASQYDPEKHLFKAFNFSSASTPMMFQVGIFGLH